MIWIPIMKQVASGGLFPYLQNVQGFIAPAIAAVFLLAIFWKRMNEFGAIAGLVLGFVAGMAKLTIQTFFGKGKIYVPVLSQIGDFNAYYATGVLFLFSIVVIIFASKMRPAPASEKTTGLTYAWLLSDKQAKK